MLISIIIPTRHRDDLLSLCLDRLAPGAQALPADQYEVIVTDDGSRSTAQRLIAEKYPWARWVAGPRRGPAANRNHGAHAATGEFLAFTDDDCLPTGNWLSAFHREIVDGTDVYEGKTTCNDGITSPLQQAPVNLKGGCLWSCNLMIRIATFRTLGGFDEDFPNAWCEDVEFFDRIKQSNIGWKFVPEAVIDHPVRRRTLGWSAGAQWKNRVLLWYKQGHQESTWTWMPVHLLKVRVRHVLEYPLSRDWIMALASIPVEFLAVVFQLSSWEKEYRHFRGPAASLKSCRL